MRKRLFLAVDPPEPLRELLAAQAAAYARACPAARPTPAGNIHLTVLFLGDVDEQALPEVSAALKEVMARTPAFTLAVGDIVLAPKKARPTMLWATFESDGAYAGLVGEARKACEPFAPRADRVHEPAPHATLARFREGQCAMRPVGPAAGMQEPFPVRECILYQSDLRPEGPRYTPLGRFALGA